MYLSVIIHTMSIMRKGAFIIAFLSFCMAIQAQFAGYPEIVTTSEDISGFLPEGWTVEHSCEADLNGDGYGDFALVIKWPERVPGIPAVPPVHSRCTHDEPLVLYYHPMLLLIVFYDPPTGGYYLAEKIEDFLVPSRTYMNWGYLKEIKTEDNSNLCFTYRYIRGMSSQDLVTDSWYVYRYHQDRFELIREGRDYLGGRFAPPHYKVKDYLQGTIRTSTDCLTWEEETFECQVPFGLERTVVKGRMMPLDFGL